MSLAAPKDTLRYQLDGRMATRRIDISKVPMSDVAASIKQFMQHDNGKTTPEGDALWFYMMNHAKGLIEHKVGRDEPLGQYLPILEAYHSEVTPRIIRMAYYILIICVREARHCHNWDVMHQKFDSIYGQAAVSYFYGYPDAPLEGWSKLVNHPPNCTFGQFVGVIKDIFNHGKFGAAYGGKKWGNIAECLERFTKGEVSADLMLDVSFSLAHNTSAIFNKGFIFAHHTAHLTRVLDIQAGGQIPQAIATKEKNLTKFMPPALLAAHKKISALFPEEFTGKIDWQKVVNGGKKAQGHYQEELQEQGVYGKQPVLMPKPEVSFDLADDDGEVIVTGMTPAELDPEHFLVLIPKGTGVEELIAEKVSRSEISKTLLANAL
jgi:hypothetical protein